MEWIKNNLSNLNTTKKSMTTLILLISSMLLSSCKDNQIKHSNQNTIENTKDQTISYKPNTQELWITSKYIMTLTQNSDGTYSISSSDINPNDISMDILQDYCDRNDMNDIIVNEENKIEIVEAIIAMWFKDKLLAEWKIKLWEYIFNTINLSDSKNILSAWPFDNWDYNETQPEIITDNMKKKNNSIINPDTLSIEDQYLLAEKKQNDSTLTEKERKKRSEIYNRLSTEIFQPSQDEITSTY